MIVLAYLQIGRAAPTTPLEMVMNATLVTKIVLIVLAVLIFPQRPAEEAH